MKLMVKRGKWGYSDTALFFHISFFGLDGLCDQFAGRNLFC